MSLRNLLLAPFFLLMSMFNTDLYAQCDLSGQVVDLSSSYGCGRAILADQTFEVFAPVGSELDDFTVGESVVFSYDLYGQGSFACSAGIPVILNCIASTAVPANCNTNFFYTVEYDISPTVSFNPEVIDNTITYEWDFGDGNISNEAVVSHTYHAQGIYEVCLTMEGGGCDGEFKCETINLHECNASFAFQAHDAGVTFENTSTGNFTDWEWDMGDGSSMLNEVLETYEYHETNIYTVCLKVWDNNGCSSQFCDYVFSGTSDMCDFTDCVLPGDTDADKTANVYDLLPLGVGYGLEGPPREEDVVVAMSWSPQFAPDWGVHTLGGHDYKHLDCNGDGQISDADVEAIEINYAAPSNVFTVKAPGAPTFWLDFQWDTILIDDNTPAFIELQADLMAGTPNNPIENLRGFALQVEYPVDKVVSYGIEVDYNDNSFFGKSNDILWMQQDRHEDDGVLDLGFVRKNIRANGFGKIATLKFIVIGDVIGRDGEAKPFSVGLNEIVAINPDGALLTVGETSEATVYVVNKSTFLTESQQEQLNLKVNVFPNPASNILNVRLDGLYSERLEVYDALGKKLKNISFSGDIGQIDVAEWGTGVYTLQVFTDQGVAYQRIIVN